MKVKVKGLVFAGLAAVIFAGNAMAAPVDTTPQQYDLDNENNLTYVTSKKYVDRVVTNAKADTTALAGRVSEAEAAIDVLEDNAERTSNKAANLADVINASDLANKYPNVGAVKNALEDKQDKSDSNVTTAGNYIQTGTGVAANLGRLDTQVKTNADAIGTINSNIGTVPEGSTVMAEIAAAQEAASYDDSALAGRVSANETAITTINNSAPMNSGITAAKVGNYDDHIANGDIHVTATQKTNWQNATDAVNNATTGLAQRQLKSDSTATAGHYIQAGTNVGENLKRLDDQVSANATDIASNTSAISTLQTQAADISGKQEKTDSAVSAAAAGSAATGGLLTQGQGVGANLVSVATQATTNKADIATINSSAVMTSGIDATKVAQIATNASNITNLQTESATHQLISNKATDVTTVAAADKDTKYPTVGAVQAPSSCNSNAPCAWINNAWVPIQQ